MPTRYAKDIVFDPATAALIGEAFDSVVATLSQSQVVYDVPHTEWMRETLALRIIETVQRGERDLERVCEDALAHLARSRPPAGR